MKVLLTVALLALGGFIFWYQQYNDEQSQTGTYETVPVISRQDILEASDLVKGIKLAVKKHDDEAVKEWLEKATKLAKEAGLAKEDIQYLESDMALHYVTFQAKRRLFNDAVEQAYYALYDIEPLKIQYPEAQDLFAKADQLVEKRDKIIQQIAAELAEGEKVDEQTLEQARQQWKQRFGSNSSIN